MSGPLFTFIFHAQDQKPITIIPPIQLSAKLHSIIKAEIESIIEHEEKVLDGIADVTCYKDDYNYNEDNRGDRQDPCFYFLQDMDVFSYVISHGDLEFPTLKEIKEYFTYDSSMHKLIIDTFTMKADSYGEYAIGLDSIPPMISKILSMLQTDGNIDVSKLE